MSIFSKVVAKKSSKAFKALPKRKNNTTDIDRRKTHFFHNALSEIRINNSLGWLLKLMFFTLIFTSHTALMSSH